MNKNIEIPFGWRFVGDNEKIIAGDKYCLKIKEPKILSSWVNTLDNVFTHNTPTTYNNVYIRKVGESAKTLKISAKCSDLMFATLYDGDGKQIGTEHDGYVPDWLGKDGYGDYVNFDIDIASGQILNWKIPSNQDLKNTFGNCFDRKIEIKDNKPKGSITIKNKTFESLNDVKVPESNKDANKSIPTIKKQCSNSSHLKLKRNSLGHFIRMDDIAEFDYPHDGKNQFRIVKVVVDTDDTIEGIQCNGKNTGYKRFSKSNIGGLYRYKGYIKAGNWD